MQKLTTQRRKLCLAVATASLAMSGMGTASAQEEQQDTEPDNTPPTLVAPSVEDMLVTGRLKSGAMSIIEERVDQAFAADLLGSEQISRAGDSNVALALLRVPGLTLIDDQYVYVRSLGERYSSAQLNGAAVPSPELTRNVLPLDLIPTSIVESVKVQKAYSPDLPANFGGGNVDIRTKSVPDELVFEVSLGTGWNSESADDGFTYGSAGNAYGLPNEISSALDTYQGRLNVQGILRILDTDGGSPTPEQQTAARTINRSFMLAMNRDIEIEEKSISPDLNGAVALGNAWNISDDWQLGGLINWSLDNEMRNKNQFRRGVGDPDEVYSDTQRTIEESRELFSVNLGLNYQDMHKLQLNSYSIENIEDEAQIRTGHNVSFRPSEGRQTLDYATRYEKRELTVNQALGEHSFDQLSGNTLGIAEVNWYYSDSEAKTDIPSRSAVKAENTIDPETGDVLATRLLATPSAASFTFLTLDDMVESYGWDAMLPLNFGNTEIKLSAGYSYNDKARSYYGYTGNIGSIGVTGDVLAGTPGQVLSDSILTNLANPFEFVMGTGLGTESYVAAQMTDASYAMIDLTWNYKWRLTGGARYEDFRQALLPIDLLDYTGASIQDLIDRIQEDDQTFAIRDDGWYPSLALTYMNQGFMGAEDFQVRMSFAQTVVRPDLREVSEVQYIDPELSIQVAGNPLLKISELDHFDIRTEWFFESGDNFTASLFYKDITNPIEQSRVPGSDDNVLLTFYNAEAGEIFGLELEGLKDIGAGFFLSGNLTLTDSEIVSPEGQGFSNTKRKMTGQSDYVLNTQLGYDSENGMHSVSVVYNLFGERIYYAARSDGNDDAFEKPFNSLNIVYSFFPTESITAKLKVSNILNEKRVFDQVNSEGNTVRILEQEVGTSVGLDLRYAF
jgi:TonB-dependent receptor